MTDGRLETGLLKGPHFGVDQRVHTSICAQKLGSQFFAMIVASTAHPRGGI